MCDGGKPRNGPVEHEILSVVNPPKQDQSPSRNKKRGRLLPAALEKHGNFLSVLLVTQNLIKPLMLTVKITILNLSSNGIPPFGIRVLM
ncbi:MAG: hypothetical protein CMP30_09730 [Roseibacillus sp.]|nr:hypothetical protein [Roseibacillus sp.]